MSGMALRESNGRENSHKTWVQLGNEKKNLRINLSKSVFPKMD